MAYTVITHGVTSIVKASVVPLSVVVTIVTSTKQEERREIGN